MIEQISDEKANRIVQSCGCDFLGSQTVERRDHSRTRMFHFRDRRSGTSLAVFEDEMTSPIVSHKVKQSRTLFPVSAEEAS